MRVHRAIVAAADIIFPCPNQFNRRASQSLSDQRRFGRYVRIDYCAAAKTTTGKFSMEGDLFRLKAEHFSNNHLVHGLKLRRNPSLRAIAIESNRGIERLHRRMR